MPKTQDQAALGKKPDSLDIFVTHRRALLNYASSIVGNRAHAEDLVQEAWLRFHEASSGRFLEDSTSYLFRIVRNLAFDGKRQMKRESLVITNDDFEAAANVSANSTPSPETVALYKDEYALVMEALAQLPERTQIAFEMHRFGGAKLREIAVALDISLPLAHRLVADALQHCKEKLGWP